MIVIKQRGSFNNLENFLTKAAKMDVTQILKKYGEQGVAALSSATPVDTGLTASSWGYEINVARNSYSISFTNSNVVDGVSIALVIEYSHGTRNGGYVEGRDYINPAIRPILDAIANEAWKEVTA